MPDSSKSETVSIAALLDDVLPLIVRAREAGEHPRYLLLGAESFDAVRAVKAAEIDRMPLMVLELELVRGDHPTVPKVF